MGFDPKKDELRKAATRQKILETAFRVFAERTIDDVNLTDVADAAGLGMATVYRYFKTKPALVTAVSTWVWHRQTEAHLREFEETERTALEDFKYYLNTFIDLYRNNRDVLRFNQYFNVYVRRGSIPAEQMAPYLRLIQTVADSFHHTYLKGQVDGTIRTDIPENEIFSATMHLMMAVSTRYAVGLVYDNGVDPEKELLLLRDMLITQYKAGSAR